jgi:hypothetical protein
VSNLGHSISPGIPGDDFFEEVEDGLQFMGKEKRKSN